MASVKKSESTKATWKALKIVDGELLDAETGEVIDNIIDILGKYFKDSEFSLTATYKLDVELD